MPQVFANAARGVLSAAISATDTSLVLTEGGNLFPVCNYAGSDTLTSLSDQNWMKLVIQDEEGIEIIHAYSHEANSNTISNIRRGQEGTTARAFSADSVIGLRPIASDLAFIVNDLKEKETTLKGVSPSSVDVFDVDPAFTDPVVSLFGGNMATYDEGGVRWHHGGYTVDLIAPQDPSVLGNLEVSMPSETGTLVTQEQVDEQKVAKESGKGLSTNDLTNDLLVKLNGIAPGAQVNVGTDLTVTPSTSTVAINSSTGSGTTLPAATRTLAGAMTGADKTKLDNLAPNATRDWNSFALNTGDTLNSVGKGATYATAAVAATLINCPTTKAFSMSTWDGGLGLTQLLVEQDPTNPKIISWVRYKNASTWSAWQSDVIQNNNGNLLDINWHNGPRTSIAGGRIACDGQQVSQLAYPEVYAAVMSGNHFLVSEETWLAEPLTRNAWSTGGSGWVRAPDLNGAYQANGSIQATGKPFYIRGGATGATSISVMDAMQAHGHRVAGSNINQGNTTGYHIALVYSPNAAGDKTGLNNYGTVVYRDDFVTDVVNGRTADETRVKTAYGVWTVTVATAPTNTGTVDMLVVSSKVNTLETTVSTLQGKVTTLEGNDGFTTLYPGGSLSSPGTLAINTRIEVDTPFPGKVLHCIAEVRMPDGSWTPSETSYSNNVSYGFKAWGYKDKVVIQSGNTGLITGSWVVLNPTGYSGATIATPMPLRVRVKALG